VGDMRFIEKPCAEFVEALASKAAVPGGGGACALVGAVGAALGIMVGNLTVGKKKYADVESDIMVLMDKTSSIQTELLRLVDEDAVVFEPLSKAYGIPKDDPKRDEIMESCLREAAGVPMRIMRLACEAIELHREFSEKGSALAVSDAGTGVVFCWAAMYGAALNVKVNTKYMIDREYAGKLNSEVSELMEKYWKKADEVYSNVIGRME